MPPGSGRKFGIYLPKDIERDLNHLVKELNLSSKSKLFQEALRLFIVENKWRIVRGRIAGAIGLLYNHDIGGTDEMITRIQHKYIDVIVSSIHVHLDEEKCLLTIIVRGDVNRVKELYKELHGVTGVLLMRPVFLE
ncbi:MAG: CopG family ribbon-helix-helix protein [Sulfolobales archaeon]|nr:CopG family ribbon-helix-helix protein [Sulfolobales archaeon]MCX8198529.1 CopG family ribbon-helix-helix protein [Sulfolobales archaeon]MDW8169602.1 CopG family ribbon-helix-helix protein [Desulfurococcaceae archaeon]